MDTEQIIKKSNFALNMWDTVDFEEMVSRSTNTYFSKIIKAPVSAKKQTTPLAIVNATITNNNKTNNKTNNNNINTY